MPAISQDGDDTVLCVKVVPGASRTRLAGLYGDRIKIAVAAAPERGKANAGLTAFLAKTLGVKPRKVVIESGHTTPLKRVRLIGERADAVRRVLGL